MRTDAVLAKSRRETYAEVLAALTEPVDTPRLLTEKVVTYRDREATVAVLDARYASQYLWPGAATLVYADPPFNMSRGYDEHDDNMSPVDYARFTRAWVTEAYKLLQPGGRLVINVPDRCLTPVTISAGMLFGEPTAWCLWTYNFGMYRTDNWVNGHNHVITYTRVADQVPPVAPVWNPEAVGVPSARSEQYGDKRTDGSLRVPSTLWDYPRVQGTSKERRRGHDNQIPELYMERVIRAYTNPGDAVVDLFTGSGTTATVATHLGRRYAGTEVSDVYAKSAVNRVIEGPSRSIGPALSYDGTEVKKTAKDYMPRHPIVEEIPPHGIESQLPDVCTLVPWDE